MTVGGRASIGALALLALVLSACTSGGSDGGPSGAATTSSGFATSGAVPSVATPAPTATTRARPSGSASSTRQTPGPTLSSGEPVEVPTDAADTCKITGAGTVAGSFRGTVRAESAGRSGTGGELCHFVVRSGNADVTVSLQMSLTRHESAAVFAQVARQPGNTPVRGVGDAAYFRSQTQTLAFRVGTTVVVLSADLPTPISAARRSVVRSDQIALGRQVAAEQ